MDKEQAKYRKPEEPAKGNTTVKTMEGGARERPSKEPSGRGPKLELMAGGGMVKTRVCPTEVKPGVVTTWAKSEGLQDQAPPGRPGEQGRAVAAEVEQGCRRTEVSDD